jgi:tetratricopeptide (TPR) repeat protein
MKPRIILSVVLFFSLVQFINAQSLKQGLDLFNQNKRTEAKAVLSKIQSTSNEYTDALLALTLIEIDNGHIDDAFEDFGIFFKKSHNPYPYIYALSNRELFTGNTEKTKGAVKAFMESLSDDSKANATIQAMAAGFLASRLKNENDIAASKEKYNTLNDVRNWSTVGIFENISSSGFNKDFGPLTFPGADHVFKNNTGADVKWFKIPDARNDRWEDMEFHYDISNSIIYAQTFLQSESDRDVTLLTGVSGSLKLWVNDFLIASETEERNTDLDVYAYKVKLQKGNNRILVQLGASEISSCNFMVRFADNDGHIITGLKTSYDYSPYTKAAAYDVQKIPFFAEAYFEDKITHNAANILDRLMLASIYSHNDKRYENRKITQQLKAEAPNSTIISEALIEAYSKDNNSTDLTREIEFIKSNDPESLIALEYRFNEAQKKEDYDECLNLLTRRIELYGQNEETDLNYVNVLARKKDIEKVLKLIEEDYKKYPNNVSFVSIEYNLQKDSYKDEAKAVNVLETYLKHNYNEDFIEALVNDKIKDNKKQEGFALFKKLIEDKPYATMRYSKMADKYFDIQDYKTSAEWMQKAIDRAPYLGSFNYSEGLIYDAAGKKEEAIACYKKAIEYAPNNYEARKKLHELEGKKDLFKNFKENDIASLFKNAPKATDYPNDNSIYLLKDMQQVIYPENGASEEKNDLLIKIFNQAGIDEWKELNINYNSYTQRLIIDKAEILKKDGSKVQADVNDNQVVFSSLEINDAVHVSYKLENAYSGKLAENFWEEFNFNSGYPMKLSRYSLLVPANKKFDYKMYNSTMQPAVTDVADGYKLYVWEKKENQRIESEASMPAFSDVVERVVVTSIPDWNYVANWYSDLSNIKVKADFEIKEKVKELLAGKEKLSELEKAKLIYNFIEENFTYSNVPFLHSALTPQRASRTLNSRLGDCKDLAVLFTSMAHEAGLDANLVLVDTRNEGDKNVDLPLIGFNHCIAQLHAGGKTYLIELTDNNLPFGAMSNILVNANGLYIPKDGAQTTNASLAKLNSVNRTYNTIDRTSIIKIADNRADITRKSKIAGAEVSSTRGAYRNQSEEDRRKEITRLLSNEFSNGLSLKDFAIKNLDNLLDTVNMEYRFTVDNYTSDIAGMKIVKLPWSDTYSSSEIVSLDKRNFALNLWNFSSTPYDKEIMTIILPAGKKWIEIPKNVNYKCSSISYSLTYTPKPGQLVVTREVKYLKDQIPVNEYAEFKEVVTKMAEADKQQMAFK